MSNWIFQDVYEDRDAGFCICKSISRYGDSNSGQCAIQGGNDSRPVGLHFLTKGSIKALDADGVLDSQFSVGDRLLMSPENALKGWAILLSKENTEYWCIADIPPYVRHWTGSLTKLEPNESAIINDVQGKRVFLPKAASIDGVEYPKHTVLRIDSKDSITVTNAGVTNVIATFWLDQ